jgi:hypothetical protein
MKAMVWRSAGTDLHLVRGTMPGMVAGTVLRHEAVGPQTTGAINGLQAEKARIPFAATTLVRIPDAVGVYPPGASTPSRSARR